MKKNCGCSKLNLSNYNNIIMTDPNYSTDSNYTNFGGDAKPIPKPDKGPTFLSYFDEANLEKNIKTDTYEQTSKLTNHEQIRHMISNLYDEIINLTYKMILDKMDKKKKYN